MPGLNLPLDVCISYSAGIASRQMVLMSSSEDLLRTLSEWKQQGKIDIWLTWGSTTDPVIDAVEEMIRSLGVSYTVPTGKRSTGRGAMPPPAGPAFGREIPTGAGSSRPLPRSVKLLATFYLLVGALALLETIWVAFQGTFHLGLGVIAIPMGVGLFCRGPAWRKLALCAAVVQVLVIGLVVYLLCRSGEDFADMTADLSAKIGPFFSKVVLGLKPEQETDELDEGPTSRGSFIHKVLEEFEKLAMGEMQDELFTAETPSPLAIGQSSPIRFESHSRLALSLTHSQRPSKMPRRSRRYARSESGMGPFFRAAPSASTSRASASASGPSAGRAR